MAIPDELALRIEPRAIRRLRSALDELAYDPVLRAVRGSYPLTPFPPYSEFRRRARSLPARERLWFELLLLGRALPESTVRDAMGAETTDDLLLLGVLSRRGTRLATPSLGLTSLDGHYTLASLPREFPACRDPDLHAYIGQETYLLAHFLPPARVRNALDLCSGSGLLGIVMAGKADRVVAVDIDPVSVNVGRFNAELNGLSARISTRQGDLWQPVAGEKFDLITFNSPFVTTPAGFRHIVFRDGGPDGLSVLGPILDGLAAHLTAQGSAVTYAEGFGNEAEPFLVRRLTDLADRDGFAIDVLLLFRFPLGKMLREAGRNRGIPSSAYRRLALDAGAKRYYRILVRIRRGPAGVRIIDAGRYL